VNFIDPYGLVGTDFVGFVGGTVLTALSIGAIGTASPAIVTAGIVVGVGAAVYSAYNTIKEGEKHWGPEVEKWRDKAYPDPSEYEPVKEKPCN
jgi:hypothetical protein